MPNPFEELIEAYKNRPPVTLEPQPTMPPPEKPKKEKLPPPGTKKITIDRGLGRFEHVRVDAEGVSENCGVKLYYYVGVETDDKGKVKKKKNGEEIPAKGYVYLDKEDRITVKE